MRPSPLPLLALLAGVLPAQNQGIHLTTGIDGTVEVPFSPLLVPPTGLTVEAWITYDDSTVPTGVFYWPTIARQNITPNGESWLLRVGAANTNNRNVEFGVRLQGGGLNVLTYTFAAGEFAAWTHLAATFDGQTMRIFKNGVQVSTRTTILSEVQNLGGVLRIGNGDASFVGREVWNGDIDEVRIWPFARTAGEILATMNQELQSMPGKVITFNLNGNYTDSSRGLVGVPQGTVAFVTGAPGLASFSPLSINVGQSTTTCVRTIDSHLGSLPQVGNSAFALWATQGPRPAVSPFGLVVGATATAPPGQPSFFGIALAFDLTAVAAQVGLFPATGILGNARFALPLPNQPGLIGSGLVMQFGFADSQCGPMGFSASDGIVFTVQ